jgi:hypothetical protein
MTCSNEYTYVIRTDIQEIHEQQTCRSFDEPTILKAPQVGSILLRIVDFGMVTVIGFEGESTLHCP